MPNPMYGPFSAGTGASFADADWRDLFSDFLTDGVIAGVLSTLAVSAGATTTINVGAGQSFTRGLHFKATTTTNLAIAAANPTNPRIDLVVVHANLAGGQTVALQVITGTPAGSPVAPTVTQTEGTAWEIALAQVLVPANASSSAAYTITDVRSFARATIPAGGITDAMLANAKVSKAGDAMTGILQVQVAPDAGGTTIHALDFGASAHDGYLGSAGFGATADVVVLATQNLRLDVGSGFHIFTGNAPATNNTICDANAHGSLLTQHSISATGTVTHGLGYTPNEVHTEQATSGSQTTGHDSVGSTTYHVTLGASSTSDTFAG